MTSLSSYKKIITRKTCKGLLIVCVLLHLSACEKKRNEDTPKENKLTVLETAQKQYNSLYKRVKEKETPNAMMPRTIENGKLKLVGVRSWTSGFFPGSLWYLYQLSNDEAWKTKAIEFTEKLDTIQYYTKNHDVGFMIGCSYGNALKSLDSKPYEDVIVQTAKSLATRYRSGAKIIQSWYSTDKWKCPVIIDNMMNLELLFEATKISGDSTFYNIAVNHADSTIKNHFRADNSTYHVIDYDPDTGEVLKKNTHQGLNDESAWARGQAWGLYGYTVCYRETKDEKYLNQANTIADYIMNHANLPQDKIPYWDYDADASESTPRDASAAAITASALYELSKYTGSKKDEYLAFADGIMNSLTSDKYLASFGSNGNFILKHSTGNLPHNSEIDAPINYADYYFLEALIRQKNKN